MTINHLLYDLGSPANIGTIMRSVYVLCGKSSKLFIFDPRGNLQKYKDDIERISTGLSNHNHFAVVANIDDFVRNYSGRKITTEITPSAVSLAEFSFLPDDLVIYGNENRGIPESITTIADASVIVPMLGENYALPQTEKQVASNYGDFPNLNVGHVVSIVSYEALRQLGSFKEFKL